MYTDEKILEALAQDPEEGAKLLVEKYFSIIRSTCAKKLKNKEDIQECVNDVFAEFCLNYTQYDNGKSNLKNYLCTIAKRRAIDRYRQNCRNEKLEEEIQKRYKDDLTDKENQAKNIEQLEEALVQLEPLDQQIIKKHYYEGQTYGEIAKELDMNYENVKKRGFRGKKKLLYLILIGLLIIGITACTTVVMKKYNLLPEWFPFYDWIFPDGPDGEESNKNGVEEKLKISIDTERNQETEEEAEEEAEGIKETDTEEVTVSTEKDTEGTTKKYQFSSQSGFRWSDKPTYELVKTEQYYEKDEIRYEISEACYQEGKITVTFYVKWLNPVDMKEFTFDSAQDWVTYDMYVDEKWHKAAAAVLDTAYILLENGETVEFLDQRTGIPETNEGIAYFYKYAAEWNFDSETQEQLKFSVVLDEKAQFELTLSKVEVQEYEENEKAFTLPDDSELKSGPAITEDGVTVVTVYQENIREYGIAKLISNSYIAALEKEKTLPYLVDEEGTIYNQRRISMTEEKTEKGTTRQFVIYFPDVEAGDYTLVIPQLCMEKEMSTETVRFEVPTGEEGEEIYKDCDVEMLFPDGSGIGMSGITRTDRSNYLYYYDMSTNSLIPEEIKIWDYKFQIAMESENEMELIGTSGEGISSEGISTGFVFNQKNASLEIKQELSKGGNIAPEWIEIKLKNPVYLLDEEYTFPITISSTTE